MSKNATLPTVKNQSGFFYGYVVVIAAFFVLAVIHAGNFSFGIFFKPMLEDFGWTRAETSGAQSMSMLVLGIVGVLAGRLNDRFGPRIVVSTCGVILGLGYMLLSRIEALWQLYLLYGVVALGMSGGFIPAMSSVARWFIRRRGLMSGIVSAGGGAGTVIGAPLSGWLIARYGWRIPYLLIGITSLVLLVIAAQFLKRDPSEMGLHPHVNMPSPEAVKEHESSVPEEDGHTLRSAVRTRQFWMLALLYASFGISLQGIMVHIVPHAIDLGVSPVLAANILTVVGGVNVLGRIGIGSVCDRIGNRQALSISFGVMLASLVLLFFAREIRMIQIFAVFFGIGFAGGATIISPVVAELFGMKAHGVVLGVVAFAWAAGGAIGPVLAGYIFDVTGSYYLAFVLFCVLALISFVMVSLLRPQKAIAS